MLHTLQKANMLAFYAKQFILALFAESKQLSNLSKGACYLAKHLAFANPSLKTDDVRYAQV